MLATGRGLVVLECDTQRAITQAHEQLGVPEATPTLSTPRGGRHFYLAGRAPNRTDFQPGIDLRGSGGYAVGAGARRPDGVYEWIVPPWEVEEAPIPAELERLIREIKKGETARRAPRPAHHHWDPHQVPRRQGWLHATGWDERRGDPGRPTRREHHRMPATSQGARGRPDRQELARRWRERRCGSSTRGC